MNLKTSALLALIGMALLTILLVMSLIVDVSGWMNGVVAALVVLKSLIHVFASVSMLMFFYTFHKAQR